MWGKEGIGVEYLPQEKLTAVNKISWLIKNNHMDFIFYSINNLSLYYSIKIFLIDTRRTKRTNSFLLVSLAHGQDAFKFSSLIPKNCPEQKQEEIT